MKLAKNDNSKCRQESKNYLECRMDRYPQHSPFVRWLMLGDWWWEIRWGIWGLNRTKWDRNSRKQKENDRLNAQATDGASSREEKETKE